MGFLRQGGQLGNEGLVALWTLEGALAKLTVHTSSVLVQFPPTNFKRNMAFLGLHLSTWVSQF